MKYYKALFLLVFFLAGCATWAEKPLQVLTYDQPGGCRQGLIVFLRGMGSGAGKQSDAHLGYYIDRSMIARLKEDVIEPAKMRGCRKIWLIGVSMGGLGAILYLKEHPQDVAGIYLMAPFLGKKFILNEIEAAGGVRLWNPGVYQDEDDWERMLWHWIKTAVGDHPDKMIYLGYGTDDFYRQGSQLLAEVLPPDRVYAIPGGHDYPTFKALWKLFLSGSAPLKE